MTSSPSPVAARQRRACERSPRPIAGIRDDLGATNHDVNGAYTVAVRRGPQRSARSGRIRFSRSALSA